MEHDQATGEVINIGGVQEVSILELAEMIKELRRSAYDIVFVPYNQAFGRDFEDMQRRVPGIDKIRKMTGFEPTTDLKTILKAVIEEKEDGLKATI